MSEFDRASPDVTHVALRLLFLALLIAASFWILSPFLTSILWAAIVSVTTWPLLLKVESAVGGRRGLAVAIMTTAILLVVFVPFTLALTTIVRNARGVSAEAQALQGIVLPGPPDWLESVPLAGKPTAERWNDFVRLGAEERAAVVAPYVQSAFQWFAQKAGSIGMMLLQFLLTAIVSAILFAQGEAARDALLRFAERLGGAQGRDTATLAARAIRGIVLGVVVTAVIQTTIGGAALFITGIPGAPLLAAVMLFLCLAQLGPLPVVLPCVFWLYWSGRSVAGTTLLVLGVIAGLIDNVIRPVLIRRGVDMPLPMIFAGVIGGLIAFGVIGLFIGPVVLAVARTLLNAWMASPPESAHASRIGVSR
jgi:predicted PurR-regulated permease PerM